MVLLLKLWWSKARSLKLNYLYSVGSPFFHIRMRYSLIGISQSIVSRSFTALWFSGWEHRDSAIMKVRLFRLKLVIDIEDLCAEWWRMDVY
jgi:hypothetical protein